MMVLKCCNNDEEELIAPWKERCVDLVGKKKASVVFHQDSEQEGNLGHGQDCDG